MKKRLFMLFLTINHLSAYVYQAVILRKKLSGSKHYHYVLGLGDFHDAVLPEDEAHRNILKLWLEEPQNKGLRVITEDLNVPNAEGRYKVKEIFIEKPEGAFLGGITEVCRAAGADALNVEYRYARLISFGKKSRSLSALKKLSIADLIQEVEHELACVAKYSDGYLLDTWYAQEVAKIRSTMQAMNWGAHAHENVVDYTDALTCSSRKEHILFDRTILDMKIVHDIVSCAGATRTCIIAGGSHLERIIDRLKPVGYEVVTRIYPHCPLIAGFFSIFMGEKSMRPYPVEALRLYSFLNKFSE